MLDFTMNLLYEVETINHDDIKVYTVYDGEDLLILNMSKPRETYITQAWADDPIEIELNLLKNALFLYDEMDEEWYQHLLWVLNDGDLGNYDWREYITEEERMHILEVIENV